MVRELVRVKAGADHRIEEINGAPVLRLRGRLLPIIALSALIGSAEPATDDGFIVVTQIGERQFGILVDSVFHTEEIVVKPMSSKLRHIPLFSGNTILGDGAVVLIVDPNGVAGLIGAAASGEAMRDQAAAAPASPADERTTMLVFRTGADSVKAVPLSLVTRLEEVDAGQFQTGGGRILLHYRNRLIPVVPVAETKIRSEGLQPLVIISEGELTLALAVDAIVDIVDEALDVEMAMSQDRSVIGSAVIRGRATDIIDLAHYLPMNEPGWLHSRRDARDPAAAPQILLVEPSDFLREMLSPVLKASGHRVALASDFEAAGQQFATGAMGTVLLDLDRDPEAAFAFARHAARGTGRQSPAHPRPDDPRDAGAASARDPGTAGRRRRQIRPPRAPRRTGRAQGRDEECGMSHHGADRQGTDRRGVASAPVGFGDSLDYVTVIVSDQLLGLPIGRVHDVFITNRITVVPRAPSEIVGLLNLRGRIVTAICLRKRLGLAPADKQGSDKAEMVAVGIDHDGEAYALIVDAVGEVMRLDQSTLEPPPVHLDRGWAALAAGVHRLADRLLVVLDVDAILKLDLQAAA